MAWAKLDDRYDDNPKIKRAWKRHPAAVGLHTMAVTYCCRHELDGVVDIEWIEEKLPVKRERELVCDALVEIGLFDECPGGFMVRNFLEFNPSRVQLEAKRTRDRLRKESNRNPDGKSSDATRPPAGAPAGAPAGREGTGVVVGVPTALMRAAVDDGLMILAARWQDADALTVESAAGMYPTVDLMQGCRLAVTWASDPTWETQSCAATLRAALRKLDSEKPKDTARRKRGADALRTLMTSTEGAA